MRREENRDLWKFRESAQVKARDKFFLLVLVIAGIVSVLYFADWWFREKHINTLWFFILLSLFFWYGIFRLIFIWINYLHIKKPLPVDPEHGLRVAIFTTSSPGEPLEMFEKTLAACRDISYPHTTYLLDDTQDPAFRAVAERYGAVWLELVGLPGAKAGKVNKALELTDEEFILIMDPDHIPFPNFLDHTLGFFQDENVGFVQVSQAYYNQYRSFTAKGAAEQTYTFYGPTQMGLFGLGGAVAIGANCTFRRKALESIGGHGVGLAEDLITSIRIHAAKWKSVFNPVIVSRGLVPEEFGSFCKQQLKWSRGVFEVVFVEVPKLFNELTGWQRISYLMIGTYYLVGASSFLFTLIPFIFFLTGMLPARMSFVDFLIYGSLVAIIAIFIYLYVQRWLCHHQVERGLHWRGMVLKFASWPVFFLGFLLAVVNAEIPYIPTAKKAVTGYFTPFARPLIIQVAMFVVFLVYIIIQRRFYMSESELVLSAEKTWAMIGFAFIAFLMSLGGIIAAWQGKHIKVEDPWDRVDLDQMKT
ncbi:MAG: glycosyltransferase [Bacteroidales bacterium]|nr:glycosyltransferase [Bacteroidota bacterium]MBL6950368.1 glycosyltransferase [Bacteroidales bacterium]